MLGWRGHKRALTAERIRRWEDGRKTGRGTGKDNQLKQAASVSKDTLLSRQCSRGGGLYLTIVVF